MLQNGMQRRQLLLFLGAWMALRESCDVRDMMSYMVLCHNHYGMHGWEHASQIYMREKNLMAPVVSAQIHSHWPYNKLLLLTHMNVLCPFAGQN
jgi:hypothetical protein